MLKESKKVYKSTTDKVIAGVMGGFGEYFDVDPVVLRAGYVAFSIFTGLLPGALTYFVMAAIIPPKLPTPTEDEVKH